MTQTTPRNRYFYRKAFLTLDLIYKTCMFFCKQNAPFLTDAFLQITNQDEGGLVEVGPRFCLWLIKIFSGSFSGNVIFENPTYKSPNQYRTEMKVEASLRYVMKLYFVVAYQFV